MRRIPQAIRRYIMQLLRDMVGYQILLETSPPDYFQAIPHLPSSKPGLKLTRKTSTAFLLSTLLRMLRYVQLSTV
jgi:hypothetical protein